MEARSETSFGTNIRKPDARVRVWRRQRRPRLTSYPDLKPGETTLLGRKECGTNEAEIPMRTKAGKVVHAKLNKTPPLHGQFVYGREVQS